MSVNLWFGCLAFFVVIGLPGHFCNADLANGAVITCKEQCHIAIPKCIPHAGYRQDKSAPSKCIKRLGSACTGTSACDGDSNSVCKNFKCECADNFIEKNSVCTANKVSAVVCTNGGSECDTYPKAACDVKSLKCKCDDGYKEDSNNGSLCVQSIRNQQTTTTLISKACTTNDTECNSFPNAECDTAAKMCRSRVGFKMNVDTCEANNTGVSTTMTFAVLAIPVVLAMRETLKMICNDAIY